MTGEGDLDLSKAELIILLAAIDEAISSEISSPPVPFPLVFERGSPWRRRNGYRPQILVIDDDIAILDLLKSVLSSVARVHIVNDGMTALAALRTIRYDLVVLDHNMPFVGGLDILENGRMQVGGVQIPSVVVSGMDDAENVARAMQAGARKYISKPFHTGELLSEIDAILAGEAPIVLVADDDPFIRIALGEELKHAGAKVVFASSCEETLRVARNMAPHLIILDRSMSDGDGLDVLKTLRVDAITSASAIVFLSGCCSETDVWEAYLRDADDFIKKPCAANEVVHRCLDYISPLKFDWKRLDASLHDAFAHRSGSI